MPKAARHAELVDQMPRTTCSIDLGGLTSAVGHVESGREVLTKVAVIVLGWWSCPKQLSRRGTKNSRLMMMKGEGAS